MTEDTDLIGLDDEDVIRVEAARQRAQTVHDEAAALLESRGRAYTRVFAGDATAEDVQIVLGDLALFCRAESTTFDPDPRVHAMLEGRREVWLRIQDFRRLPVSALLDKYR